MNFYISTFKVKKWLFKAMASISLAVCLIFGFNVIVDPYNITQYNILNIEHKFARDDRTEKVNYFKTLPQFDNILIGSSRVYTINPTTVSEILGGTTYNFGVGTATVEDHLGTILYLKRLNKLPRRIILGVDFYTFNKNIPPNSYFLSNEELNFLSYGSNVDGSYWAKFLSFDALRASYKTFKNHITEAAEVPRFDRNGWSNHYLDNDSRNLNAESIAMQHEIEKNRGLYSNYLYDEIDFNRVKYYQEIKKIAKKHDIELYVFMTPLHPNLIKTLNDNPTKKALEQLDLFLSTFQRYENFLLNEKFNTDLYNFHGATHTTSLGGDKMMHILLKVKHNCTKI